MILLKLVYCFPRVFFWVGPGGPGAEHPAVEPTAKAGESGLQARGQPNRPAIDQAATTLIDAYDILRRLRCDYRGLGRSREVIEEWTDRAVKLYRQGRNGHSPTAGRAVFERGLAALELARAVDHARNASRFEQFDPDLPDPPPNPHPRRNTNDIYRNLAQTRDRIVQGLREASDDETAYYAKAARDLYNAAGRDVRKSGLDRGAELAMAAERMIAVYEHIAGSLAPDLAKAPQEGRVADRNEAERNPRPVANDDSPTVSPPPEIE